MEKIPVPKSVNYDDFTLNKKNKITKYGLPEDVKFCSKCVISNQRPNSAIEYTHTQKSIKKTINFDENGVCDACNYSIKKNNTINWDERERELIELCNMYRSKDGRYDCIVPGSGGKDSFYASHILKTKYNMHPLTVTWAPHIYTDWGWKNFQSWIHAGHDNILFTPNGKIHRLLTRLAVDNLFHPFQPFVFGQKFLAPKMALLHNIKLVFFGENEAEYGNPISDTVTSQRDAAYFSTNEIDNIIIGGVSAKNLKKYFGIDNQDLLPYLPADPQLISKSEIEVHYLGYYLKWHPQSCYYYATENSAFQASPERTPGTYSKYNSIDDRIDDFHYYTTGIKFGIGRATYDAAQEIRSGDITREEGVALVKRFDHEFPSRFMDEIFKYLSITKNDFPIASEMFEEPIMTYDYFMKLADNFRSPHLWRWSNNSWELIHTVWNN